MKDHITLRSTITPQHSRFVLLRGSFLGLIGCTLFLYGGVFLPLEQLETWGLPVFGLGVLAVTIGLLPYRQIVLLQHSPYELEINEEQAVFIQKEKPVFSVALESLDQVSFLEKGNQYGMACWLKKPLPEKISVIDPRFDIARFQKASRKRQGCDLFFPYFTQRSCDEMMEILNP